MDVETFLVHLRTIAAAPGGVERIREVILELALSGRLVAQDPNEEPPTASLNRIRAIRGSVIKAKVKGRSDVPRAPQDWECDRTIPAHWEWARLDDTGEYVNGLAFKQSEWSDTGYPIIRIQNLTDPDASFNYAIGPFPKDRMVTTGDILVSWSATLDAFIWDRGEAVVNQHIFKVIPDPTLVYPGFLYHLLRNVIRSLADSDAAHGLAMKHINRGPFVSHPVAIPPLAEQQRIVAKVEELMLLCDEVERRQQAQATVVTRFRASALDVLTTAIDDREVATAWTRVQNSWESLIDDPDSVDDVRRVILRLAVRGRLVEQNPTDAPAASLVGPDAPIRDYSTPFSLPAGWEWVRLRDLLTNGLTNGWSPTTVEFETGVKTLKLTATTSGWFDSSHTKYVDADLDRGSKYWLRDGDLLIQRSNTPSYVGMAALYEGPDNEYIFPDLMMRGRPSEGISGRFIHLALISPDVRESLKRRASGTSQSMVKLSQGKVLETLIPIAPRREQDRIVMKVDQLLRLSAELKNHLQVRRKASERFAASAVHSVTI